jgi:non-homologous end joining protein Ku
MRGAPNAVHGEAQVKAETAVQSSGELQGEPIVSIGDFDFAAYEDPDRERPQELIEAKIEGREIIAPEEEEKPEVVNLMDALKKSISRQ